MELQNEKHKEQVEQQRAQDQSLLLNYFNNIAEFSKFNDIDMFDQQAKLGGGKSLVNDTFIRSLLTSLEFLAHKW